MVELITDSLTLDETPAATKAIRWLTPLIKSAGGPTLLALRHFAQQQRSCEECILVQVPIRALVRMSPQMWYRTGFEPQLPKVFTSLHTCLQRIDGRASANMFREQVH